MEEIPLPPESEMSQQGYADMREAADFLMEDEASVPVLLHAAGIPLVEDASGQYVSRLAVRKYREQMRADKQAGAREITRLSVAAGLDDLDYSSLTHPDR